MNTEENRVQDETAASDAGDDAATAGRDEPLDERLIIALQAASDKKALAPVVLDLRPIASFTDYFVITSGTNARQVQAIADEVTRRLKRPLRVEGYATGEWVLLDYGDFVMHIFEQKARGFFDLERLWREASRVALPPEISGDGGEQRTTRAGAETTTLESTSSETNADENL